MHDCDLFGDVVVTHDDIKLWLNHIVNMSTSSKSRIEYYIKNNDVINKIKLLKRQGRFIETIEDREIEITTDTFDYAALFTKYTKTEEPPCPAYFHNCTNEQCRIYQKRLQQDKNRAYYLKRKKQRELEKKGA